MPHAFDIEDTLKAEQNGPERRHKVLICCQLVVFSQKETAIFDKFFKSALNY